MTRGNCLTAVYRRLRKRHLIAGSVFVLLLSGSAMQAADNCDLPLLSHQQKDDHTIRHLEEALNVAYLHGDTNFERCLLTPDFTEITRKGEVKALSDELALAANNELKKLPIPPQPEIRILMHGNVAVAYAVSKSNGPDGKPRARLYADYYVWENESWHAFFSQQTQVQGKEN